MMSDDQDKPFAGLALKQAKELVKSMESGDITHASELIRDLSKVREDSLFHQIGRLTRELHDSLKSFQKDSHMANLTDVDLPDARTRLNFVIEKTDEAANRTMDNIDKTIPISTGLAFEAKELLGEWGKFKRRELTVDEFRDLYENMMSFLTSTESKANEIHANLTDVVMAQDYQDITGQIIRKVITLVTDLEDSLVRLVLLAAEAKKLSGIQDEEEEKPKSNEVIADGPHVDGTIANDKFEIAKNQDDVDDLLSSLGF